MVFGWLLRNDDRKLPTLLTDDLTASNTYKGPIDMSLEPIGIILNRTGHYIEL